MISISPFQTRRFILPVLSAGLLSGFAASAQADTVSVSPKGMTSIKFKNRTVMIDRDMKAVLDSLAELGPKPIEKLPPAVARAQPLPGDGVKRLLQKRNMSTAPEPVASVTDRLVPGTEKTGQVLVRVYRPRNAPSGLLPALVYTHGGGFVIASVQDYDSSARALANAAKCIVVSVAYSYAPEKKLPTQHEETYAAMRYVMTNGRAWGIDQNRVAVGGESAGGNLATDMCLMAKMRGHKMPIHQLLVYPVTDFTPASLNAPSARKYYNAKPLNTPMLKWFGKYALPTPAFAKNPLASPLKFADVRGLPPATVVLAEIDPLQSQAMAYAMKLQSNGVPVRWRLYRGVTHEFFGMGAVVPAAKAAVAFSAAGLRTAFDN